MRKQRQVQMTGADLHVAKHDEYSDFSHRVLGALSAISITRGTSCQCLHQLSYLLGVHQDGALLRDEVHRQAQVLE